MCFVKIFRSLIALLENVSFLLFTCVVMLEVGGVCASPHQQTHVWRGIFAPSTSTSKTTIILNLPPCLSGLNRKVRMFGSCGLAVRGRCRGL